MKKFLAQAYLWLLLAVLYAPILIIVIFSFTEAKVLGSWSGFSTNLYTSLFAGDAGQALNNAIFNTLFIALVAAVVSTLLGAAVSESCAVCCECESRNDANGPVGNNRLRQ